MTHKLNLLNGNHLLVWHKNFKTGTMCKSIFGLAKKFGPAQNVVEPLEGQGIKAEFAEEGIFFANRFHSLGIF